MDLVKEHNKKYEFFREITGVAMKVYNKYKSGLLESAYEAAMKYLLEKNGYSVEPACLKKSLSSMATTAFCKSTGISSSGTMVRFSMENS